MPSRIGPRDRMLLAGLAVTLIVVFASPVRLLLDTAQEADRNTGLSLFPGLLILTVFFLFHQFGKRHDEKAHARAAAADAVMAEARADVMERLVMFGQALGRALDLETIRDVVSQHLPKLTDSEEAWVLMGSGTEWQALIGTALQGRRDLEHTYQHIAQRACGPDRAAIAGPIEADGHLCLPMAAGGRTIGVLGVPANSGPFTESRRRVLAAAATLLGISLQNAELFRKVRENSLRDGLTGCFNRTHALDVIDTELRRARRSQSPIALIMFDIDHFKEINDRHGHLCGDLVLAAVGVRMREVLRGSDLKCRYGGEEFLVLLPETALDGAKRVADTLRRELAEMHVEWQQDRVRVTASFGVTAALPSEIDTAAIIGRADAALYRAKDQGRNCVRVGLESAVA
jgi:diguanylate cyclase (GGDEF)-like protein